MLVGLFFLGLQIARYTRSPMKVLGLNPPSKFSKNVARDLLWGCWCKGKRIAGVQFPPLPLLYVATVLRDEGHDVAVLDAAGEGLSFDEVKKRVADFDVVFLISATMSFNEDAALLLELKEANPNLRTIDFGAHATFKPEEALLRPGVDVIVRHEAEHVIRDLVRAWSSSSGAEWKGIPGVGYLENGIPVINAPYPFLRDLDVLPIPDRTFLPRDLEYYNPIVKRIPATTALSSRGCPSLCTFCTAPAFYGAKYRARSASNVLQELEYLQGLGFKEVFFRDELFTVIPQRVVSICEGILERGIDVSWICSVKVGSVDRATLDLMRRAGCHMIRIGAESGNQVLLDNVKKGVKVSAMRDTFRWTHEVGLDTHAHMMLGLPGETPETILESLDFIDEIRPTTVTYGITTPYPGTPLYDELLEEHPEMGDGSAIDARSIHTDGRWNQYYTSLSPQELSDYVRRAYRRFYMRPSYVFGWLKRVRSWQEMRRLSLAGANVFDFIVRGDG